MEDILKYQRIQGAVDAINRYGNICSAAIETNYLVLGTENGDLHVLSFTGQHIQKYRSHERRIVSISLHYDGCLTILSASEDGKVVTAVLGDEMKESYIKINDKVSCACIENGTISKRERSFIVGTASGALLYHRSSWLGQKVVTLFAGEGSPVSAIAWKGGYISWADASVVRVMDISTQTAICQVSAPYGVGPEDPYPCHLYWRNASDLIVSWADSFRLLTIRTAAEEGLPGGVIKTAKTLHEWQSDCIICGLFPLDDEHVAYIGYSPPSEEDLARNDFDDDSEDSTNQVEVITAKLQTGELISADVLPLRGANMQGPFAYHMLSSYQCHNNGDDAFKWKLKQYADTRGGDRGHAPLLFMVSPKDLVVARIRDVNDRVSSALEQRDLKHAVEIALADRNALKVYEFSDLLNLYIVNLWERNLGGTAGIECARLLGLDSMLWETWVFKFVEMKQLEHICMLIPTEKPRLSAHIYEEVLQTLLKVNPKLFLDLIKKWAKVKPNCFNHQQLIDQLQKSNAKEHKTFFLEAEAQLHLVAHNYEKALNCYLYINVSDVGSDVTNDHVVDPIALNKLEHRYVFDLIEKQGLFKTVENKIINLVRLSRPLSAKLLLAHLDKLPIKTITQQLSVDRRLLYWYLNLVFKDPAAREVYANEEEFGDLHLKQVQLYAEFSPVFQRPVQSVDGSGVDVINSNNNSKKKLFETDFISFIKSGLAPLDVCLLECERRYPPLFPEMIVILSLMDKKRTALSVLLREIGDVGLAIQFIEDQLDASQESMKRQGQHFLKQNDRATSFPGEDEKAMQDTLLWNDLIQYALDNPVCLENLIDHLGIAKVEAKKVFARMQANTRIPRLKPRLLRILKDMQFQQFQDDYSKEILQKDASSLLCQKNYGQRRAIKVDSHLRCASCLRPLIMEPHGSQTAAASSSVSSLLPAQKDSVQVWGPSRSMQASTGSVIFNNKLAFHRQCYDRVPE